jgi:hypothetical protein
MLLPGDGCQVLPTLSLFGCFPRLFALALFPECLGGSQEFSHRPARRFRNWTAANPAAIEPRAEFCPEDGVLPRHQSDEQFVFFLRRELRNPEFIILILTHSLVGNVWPTLCLHQASTTVQTLHAWNRPPATSAL